MSNSEVGFRLVLSFHHVISGDRVGVGSNFTLWPSLPPRVSHSPAWPQTRWVVEEDDLELHILTCLYLLNAGITGVYRDMKLFDARSRTPYVLGEPSTTIPSLCLQV